MVSHPATSLAGLWAGMLIRDRFDGAGGLGSVVWSPPSPSCQRQRITWNQAFVTGGRAPAPRRSLGERSHPGFHGSRPDLAADGDVPRRSGADGGDRGDRQLTALCQRGFVAKFPPAPIHLPLAPDAGVPHVALPRLAADLQLAAVRWLWIMSQARPHALAAGACPEKRIDRPAVGREGSAWWLKR